MTGILQKPDQSPTLREGGAPIAAVSRIVLSLQIVLASAWLCSGCASQPAFPAPIETRSENHETIVTFDTDGDKKVDFWQYQHPGGRKQALAYLADNSDQPGERIELDDITTADCPHFLIVLDGVPFELVEQLYHEGHFRFFYPPTRVICCFPAMTDPVLAELFQSQRCHSFQALSFDREANRLNNANLAYLSGRNSPWEPQMSYRCSFWWDALVYLYPQAVFNHELNRIVRTFRTIDAGPAYAYSVGSAGLGTRGGRPAILAYLRTIDRLCEQLIYERRGQIKITLTADHGHNLYENRRISFRKTLAAGGYRQSKSLREPKDVVPISYGLVTYAEFYTADPAGVADCLSRDDGVEFACYPSADAVIVCDRNGQARIRKGETGFVYDSTHADPLRLAPLIARLHQAGKVSAAGEIDSEAFFEATLEHCYPDPLARIWNAFHGLVDNPPDLIVNLRDGVCHGSRFFHAMIGQVASTHGSLNHLGSTTFVMTMLGELPPALHTRDVLPALDKVRSGH